jgi:hypothetical protein
MPATNFTNASEMDGSITAATSSASLNTIQKIVTAVDNFLLYYNGARLDGVLLLLLLCFLVAIVPHLVLFIIYIL